MRRIRYGVAMSLDGYIADANGGADWIVMDPEIDFNAMFAQFDTFLMGRRTYEGMAKYGGAPTPGITKVVFSRTLNQRDHPGVTILNDNWEDAVRALREKPGKDIWLFGGGSLCQSFVNAGLLDGVDVGIIPVLLGGGIPFLATPVKTTKLKLLRHKLYKKSGIVSLEYEVTREGKKRTRARA